MKIFVLGYSPTALKTATELLKRVVGGNVLRKFANFDHLIGQKLGAEKIETLRKKSAGLYCSSTYTATDAIELLDDVVKVVTVRRDSFDSLIETIVSLREKPEAKIKNFVEDYSDLSNTGFVNLFIDARRKFVAQELRKIKEFRKKVLADGHITLDYDELTRDKRNTILNLLKAFKLEVTPAYFDELEETFEAERQNFFTREATAGEWRNVLDPKTINILKQIEKEI